MNTMTGRMPRILALAVIAGLVLLAAPAAADWLGEYLPLWVGNTWTYESVDVPGETFTESVFDGTVYDGELAALFGRPDDYSVVGNTGRVITVYAELDEGELVDYDPHIVIGEFDDGGYFEICAGADCDSNLIRDWEAVDPALRSFFGLDPAYDDVVLLVSFDRNYAPNFQNAVATSNLPAGATPPAGAVTGMEWYQRGLGMVAITDVDAESGGLYEFAKLIDVYVGVEDQPVVASGARLAPGYPNPFNPRTSIPYTLDRSGAVTLEIHDLAGRRVRTLWSGELAAGSHIATWDGRDDAGRGQASGTYFAHLTAGESRQTTKLVLVR